MSSRDPLRSEEGVDPETRAHVARSWSCLVRSMALYILAMDALALIFLFRLTALLDQTEHMSYASVLTPLFILYGCTIFLSPPLFLANARIDEFRRGVELAQRQATEEMLLEQGAREQQRARRAMKRARRKPKMQPASRNVFLLRQSSTVFLRANDARPSRENSEIPSSSPVHNSDSDWKDYDEVGGDSKPCYICMSSQANGVLMECGHGGLCYACGLELARKGQKCPLCRAPILEVVQIESTSLSFGVSRSLKQVTVSQRDAHRQKQRRGTSM